MNFAYDIEDEDGNIIEELSVDVRFSPYVPAVTHRRPEDCYPAEGGEIEDLWVYLDGKDITNDVDALFSGDHYAAIRERAYELYDHRKERYDDR